jgi:hypothetical protein
MYKSCDSNGNEKNKTEPTERVPLQATSLTCGTDNLNQSPPFFSGSIFKPALDTGHGPGRAAVEK